jgi:hypothetical protein
MRLQRRTKMSLGLLLLTLALGASAAAQQTPPDRTEPKTEQDVIILREPEGGPVHTQALPPPVIGMDGPDGEPMGGHTFTFVSSEMSFDSKIVKGVPYSAEAVTEVTQTLSDGNRIVRKSTASIYRDGEGRTRREHTLGSIGPFATNVEPPQTIFINDPVTGVNYVLDPRTRTARKMPLPRLENLPAGARQEMKVEERVMHSTTAAVGGPGERVMIYENREGGGAAAAAGEPAPFRRAAPGPKPVTESLGKQTIEGVQAEGTRTTITIPAGHIGNERPIQITTERWFSPELQTVVMTKSSDPFIGDTVYRLTNINRTEPARSLFEVPGDYKVKEVNVQPTIRIMRRPANEK